MKKRLIKYLRYLFQRYTATSAHIAEAEAKRYSNHLIENYSEVEQLLILKKIKTNLIESCVIQMKNSNNSIEENRIKIVKAKEFIEKFSKI